jgi:hypothetical protein
MNKYFADEWCNIWINYAIHRNPQHPNLNNWIGHKMKIVFYATDINAFNNPRRLSRLGLAKWSHNTICITTKQQHSMCDVLAKLHKVTKITTHKSSKTDEFELFVVLGSHVGNFIVGAELQQMKYIETYVTRTCIAFMHEQQCGWFANNNVEQCFADEYLLSLLLQY